MRKERIRELLQRVSDDPSTRTSCKVQIELDDAATLCGPDDIRPIDGVLNDIREEIDDVYVEWIGEGAEMNEDIVNKIYGLFQV